MGSNSGTRLATAIGVIRADCFDGAARKYPYLQRDRKFETQLDPCRPGQLVRHWRWRMVSAYG
jgi:hypothetical protein